MYKVVHKMMQKHSGKSPIPVDAEKLQSVRTRPFCCCVAASASRCAGAKHCTRSQEHDEMIVLIQTHTFTYIVNFVHSLCRLYQCIMCISLTYETID